MPGTHEAAPETLAEIPVEIPARVFSDMAGGTHTGARRARATGGIFIIVHVLSCGGSAGTDRERPSV
ncbi:hypothetical protein Mame01_39690 [Microbispora amethystogenes]|nr:hypothetical protein Mame01_39690 [Microbispora amethystogenes]